MKKLMHMDENLKFLQINIFMLKFAKFSNIIFWAPNFTFQKEKYLA
jgi:hypothetical protein